jgi:hypothetical protein
VARRNVDLSVVAQINGVMLAPFTALVFPPTHVHAIRDRAHASHPHLRGLEVPSFHSRVPQRQRRKPMCEFYS